MDIAVPQKVKVQIYNEAYTVLVSDGDAEQIQKLAALVDKRMREIVASGKMVDSRKVAILAALNIAQDLYKMKEEHDRLDQKIAERSAECVELLDQVLKGKS